MGSEVKGPFKASSPYSVPGGTPAAVSRGPPALREDRPPPMAQQHLRAAASAGPLTTTGSETPSQNHPARLLPMSCPPTHTPWEVTHAHQCLRLLGSRVTCYALTTTLTGNKPHISKTVGAGFGGFCGSPMCPFLNPSPPTAQIPRSPNSDLSPPPLLFTVSSHMCSHYVPAFCLV